MKKFIFLLLILANVCISEADACPSDYTGLTHTWSDVTHDHGSGEHTHTGATGYWTDGNCHSYTWTWTYLDLHPSDGEPHGGSVPPDVTKPPEPPEPKPEPEPEPDTRNLQSHKLIEDTMVHATGLE